MAGEHSGRVAVVTGGSRGIGRGVALELAGLGMRLAIHYRADAASAEEVRERARERGAAEARTFRADVADLDDGRRLVEAVMDAFGRVDVWVNNAGVAPEVRRDVLETTPESWDRVLGVNLRGPFFLGQEVARRMVGLVERGVAADPMIVFVTSVSAAYASTNRVEYCVSKAGLSMVGQVLAVRLADSGVRVFEVRPGVIATDMTAAVGDVYSRRIASGEISPIRRWGAPEDIGKAVAMLASGGLPFATGTILNVDGGLSIRRL